MRTKNKANRKRLRSEDDAAIVGRLKCKEDYNDDENNGNVEGSGSDSNNVKENEIAGDGHSVEGVKCENDHNDENSCVRDLEDLEDGKEKDDMNCAGDSETPKSQNVDCTSIDESSDEPSISKRKSHPRKLPPD